MLSPAAANTLLKTLEEPPAHVVLVLATTDPQKVLPTLRSRTQHFEFNLLSHGQLVGYLADILGREGVDSDPEVLDLIARRAGGSARDALSLLDQALAVGGGKHRRAAGAVGVRGRAVRAAARGAGSRGGRRRCRRARRRARSRRRRATTSGGSPTISSARCATRSCSRTRPVAFRTTARPRKPIVSPRSPKEMGNPAVVRAIEIFGDAIIDIRGQAVADPRLVLEVAVVRVARREARTRDETLLDRVERLEQRLADGALPIGASRTAPRHRPRRRGRRRFAGGPVLAKRERAAKAAPARTACDRAGPRA